MAAWNSFLALSDDDQMAIIESNEIFAFFSEEPILDEAPEAVVEKIVSHRDKRQAMTPDQAFRALGTKLRSAFNKRHFPMVNPLFSFHLKPRIETSSCSTGNVSTTGERSVGFLS